MAEPARRRMSVAEFLDWDDGTDRRYELVRGEPVAMAPAARPHGFLAANLALALGARLRRPCHVELETGVLAPDRADSFLIPDVAVACTPPRPGERHIPDPVLIAEILSPSTARHDRMEKAPGYRALPSLRHLLLVSSTERRVEHWRRAAEGRPARGGPAAGWTLEEAGAADILDLTGLGITLPVAELYLDIVLDAAG